MNRFSAFLVWVFSLFLFVLESSHNNKTKLQRQNSLEVLAAGLGPLVLGSTLSGCGLRLLDLGGKDGLAAEGLGVGVELDEGAQVLQGVLLLDGTAGLPGTDGPEGGLDLVRVDDALEISVGQEGPGEEVALLGLGTLGGGAVDGVEGLKGGASPDDEATEVTSGGEVEEVEGAHGGELNTGDVPEGPGDTLVLLVNNQGTTPLGEATVPELALTGPQLLGPLDLLDVTEGVDALEDGNSLLGLGNALSSIVDDQGDLSNLLDAVSAGHNEGGEGGGSQGRDDSEAALVLVDLAVPLAPGLGGGEHATLAAHVSESGLSGTVGSSSRDTGNTGDGATSTPGLSAVLVTSSLRDGVWLAPVLGHVGVDKLHNISADGGPEHRGEADALNGLSFLDSLNLNKSPRGLCIFKKISHR